MGEIPHRRPARNWKRRAARRFNRAIVWQAIASHRRRLPWPWCCIGRTDRCRSQLPPCVRQPLYGDPDDLILKVGEGSAPGRSRARRHGGQSGCWRQPDPHPCSCVRTALDAAEPQLASHVNRLPPLFSKRARAKRDTTPRVFARKWHYHYPKPCASQILPCSRGRARGGYSPTTGKARAARAGSARAVGADGGDAFLAESSEGLVLELARIAANAPDTIPGWTTLDPCRRSRFAAPPMRPLPLVELSAGAGCHLLTGRGVTGKAIAHVYRRAT